MRESRLNQSKGLRRRYAPLQIAPAPWSCAALAMHRILPGMLVLIAKGLPIKRLRSIRTWAVVMTVLPLLTTGCFFNLSEKKDFRSWYFGDPGMAGALGETDCDRYADKIQGARQPYYLHFRTPEVLLQPQGGVRYPERSTAQGRTGSPDPTAPSCEQVARGWETFSFDTVDAGLVDTVIPYRKASTINAREPGYGQAGLAYAGGVVYNVALAGVMKAPIYIVHDVLKTLYIPVAGVYYLLKPDTPPETLKEDTRMRETPSAADLRSGTDMTGAASGAGVPVDKATNIAMVAEDEAETGVTIFGLLAANEDAVVIVPEAPVGAPGMERDESPRGRDRRTDERPGTFERQNERSSGEDSVGAAAATLSAMAREDARDTGPQKRSVATATPSNAQAPDAAKAAGATRAAEPAPDSGRAAENELVFVPSEEGESLPADEVPVVPHRPPPTPQPVVTETPAPRSAPSGGGEIVAEDFPKTVAAAAEGDVEEDGGTVSSRPGAVDAAPPVVEPPAATPRAGPAPQADAAEAPAVRGPVKEVRIAKRKLRKKVAFIGLQSRNINVDDDTRDDFEDLLWPVFEAACGRNTALVRQGDADYPSALDFLVRDQFGRLNSFELTTVARFSGLNAIIVGTIIDVRVANKISGILWYKSPEGRLRFAAMIEVYDAETGTKLFDQTYVRDEEVEELEPGADEHLRIEDQAVLEAVLRSVAEEMGEQVCEALGDQPWRAFVSAIDGDRITLSAGQGAGLAPGNILAVYNSQIIDGLNNQQFFLTGEKVGRIQIHQVFANRSEAVLIEGGGLRDYSVAMPD
jgi:hypothetical protein